MPFDQISTYDLAGSKPDRLRYLADFIEFNVSADKLYMGEFHRPVELYAATGSEATHGKCGDLVMRDNEFHDFVDLVKTIIEIRPEYDLTKTYDD